ncbi:alpha/beta fold hydrolase [Nocardia sp. NPDC059229]|uniref:alpha/beta fold hydrolase n=1 Tax=Nocardia sp. NPDC059229 TaxID=3346778 RepID=UPI003683444D
MEIDSNTDRRRRWLRALSAMIALLYLSVATPSAVSSADSHADLPALDGGRFVETAVARFHFLEAGQGPPIVLLPGGTLWSYTYRDIIGALAADHTVYAVDLPGSGFTTLHDADFGYDVRAMTEALRQFMSAAGIARASVLAHSLSGSVAVDFAARYPSQVDQLVLISPLVLDTELNVNLQLMRTPVLGELATRVMTEDIYVAGLRDAYARPEELTRELADTYWIPQSHDENRTAMWKQPRNLDLSQVQWEASTIRARTLILWGEQDRVISPSQAQQLAHLIPTSTLRMLAGAGHNAHEDDPAAVATELTGFLSS